MLGRKSAPERDRVEAKVAKKERSENQILPSLRLAKSSTNPGPVCIEHGPQVGSRSSGDRMTPVGFDGASSAAK
jgi:hypothetical protein